MDKVVRHGYTDEDGNRHWFRFVNGVPINKSHKEVLVNYLEYVEISPKGKKYTNTWVTDIKITIENVTKVMRGYPPENAYAGYNIDSKYSYVFSVQCVYKVIWNSVLIRSGLVHP